jgi:3-hydroxybutyryl-CoA dehydrogenase
MIKKVCVVGAGTMGSGIALCAAQHGYDTLLFDLSLSVLDKAQASMEKTWNTAVEKGKLTAEEKAIINTRLHYTNDIQDCTASLIIEAIVEKYDVKQALFKQLAAINTQDTILVSNTSSLSINLLQQTIPQPQRFAGLHFFNPAHLMKLVEVVKGEQTDNEIMDHLTSFCHQLQKVPVVCKDAPGFIVNRVARPYYLTAMRLVEAGLADMETIDALMENAGFRMGPFRLMDLIGNDINLAVSQSLHDAFDGEPRFEPNALQRELVQKGELGKKTGKGFYSYT